MGNELGNMNSENIRPLVLCAALTWDGDEAQCNGATENNLNIYIIFIPSCSGSLKWLSANHLSELIQG